ncbi:hypothetical protein BDY17DRAFT_293687 [Neohortaea acidophila]|uniref:Alpha/beta hydrolase fold-3 domain-containing protein n=1 Tax=Neohortaea acidophila TaxID=245834 RepID=A0A6A6Q243_9PEZI|nr:uncharacterized protein BDY17DRAFT_293687 [Neohortaea acidophila]KAF2485477.1 hypothetical protein BDY17DRAFT_293687 [Neohortaea acidophila]
MIRCSRHVNSTRRLSLLRSNCWSSRRYSSPSPAERVQVAVQSNGSITLDVHQPQNPSPDQNRSTTALLYLPRGPLQHSAEHDASNIDIMRSVLPCPIVQVNYRLSRTERYPTPIHDVLSGYDWVRENLLPKRSIGRAGRSEHIGRLAICGELIGGGLASMLSLTECRVGEPGIVAAAINNPLVDWISLTIPSGGLKSTKRNKPAEDDALQPDLKALSTLRAQLFHRPYDYFDSFASPILYFRSPGAEVPPAPALPLDEMDHLSLLERQELLQDEDMGDIPESPPQRKVSKRFPSKALRLRLPSFHISAGTSSPTRWQTEEFTTLLRKSVARQSKEWSESADFGRKVLYDEDEGDLKDGQLRDVEADVDKKVRMDLCAGGSEWDDSDAGRKRVRQAAEWLRQALHPAG